MPTPAPCSALRPRRILPALAFGLLATTASAQDPPLALRSLAATCAQCHGTDGRAAADSLVPALAGQPAEQLLARLTAFRNGSVGATVMTQIARGYSEAQLRALAAYFAARPR